MTPAERRRAGVAKLARLLGAGPGPGAARTEVRVLRQIVRAGEGGDVEGVLRLAQDRRVCCPGRHEQFLFHLSTVFNLY